MLKKGLVVALLVHESNLKDKAEKFSLSAAQHQSAGRPRPSSSVHLHARCAARRTSRRCYQNKVCLSLVTSQPPVCLTKFSHKKQPLYSWPESSKSKSKPPMAAHEASYNLTSTMPAFQPLLLLLLSHQQ